MQHGITRDGVDFLVAPAVGIDGAREGGLLAQDVVPLQHDSQRFATQETVRQLHVPYHLIGVQRLVAIAALAVHVEVGTQVGAPWEGYLSVAAIGEVPRRQVVRGLQTVLCAGIRGALVQRDAEPRVAIAERYLGRQVVGVCHVAVRLCRAVQVHITDAVVVASVDGAADVPTVQRVQSDVERQSQVGIPVAVDVLRSSDASTRLFVIGDDVTYRVAGGLPRTVDAEAPVALVLRHLEAGLLVGDKLRLAHHLEVGTQIGGERGFQSGVTHRDAQRIGVVVDVQQLGDVGLLRLCTEVYLQVSLLVEAHAQVHRR